MISISIDVRICWLGAQVRGGHIVPLQQPAMTTGEMRVSPLTLVVALQSQVPEGKAFFCVLETRRVLRMSNANDAAVEYLAWHLEISIGRTDACALSLCHLAINLALGCCAGALPTICTAEL